MEFFRILLMLQHCHINFFYMFVPVKKVVLLSNLNQ